MAQSGPAVFFDGKTSIRHAVTVELDRSGLLIRSATGSLLARWPYDELEQASAHEGVFRIGRLGGTLERIEIRDPALAHAIDVLSLPVDRSGLRQRRGRRKVVIWSVAAVASLLLVGIFGIPELATRAAPLVPYRIEQQLGDAVDVQVRAMLDPGKKGEAFVCGTGEQEKAGQAALLRMVGKLETAAQLPIPLRLKVVRHKQANAIALPGGYIYVFEGLIEKADNPDEVAGVIAHEIGHVANRDGMRSVLQAGGLAFLFGLVLGDFVGGGAVILASRTILRLAYSRHVEAQADVYAVGLMQKVGGDPRALSIILTRIAGAKEPSVRILTNHPATKERARSIEDVTQPAIMRPIIEPAEWAALKRICAGG
jgi:Zn-dependent protease with chaperone function